MRPAGATWRPPKLASNSLHSEPPREYTHSLSQESGAKHAENQPKIKNANEGNNKHSCGCTTCEQIARGLDVHWSDCRKRVARAGGDAGLLGVLKVVNGRVRGKGSVCGVAGTDCT